MTGPVDRDVIAMGFEQGAGRPASLATLAMLERRFRDLDNNKHLIMAFLIGLLHEPDFDAEARRAVEGRH